MNPGFSQDRRWQFIAHTSTFGKRQTGQLHLHPFPGAHARLGKLAADVATCWQRGWRLAQSVPQGARAADGLAVPCRVVGRWSARAGCHHRPRRIPSCSRRRIARQSHKQGLQTLSVPNMTDAKLLARWPHN